MQTRILALAAVAGGALAALLLGQTAGVSPDPEWEIVSQHVAGTGGSAGGGQSHAGGSSGNPVYGYVFLYSNRSGKVYRYFPGCTSGGVESKEGCFFAIPVIDNRQGFQVTPQPTADIGGPTR